MHRFIGILNYSFNRRDASPRTRILSTLRRPVTDNACRSRVGNPGTMGDQLTLTVLDADGHVLSAVSKMVPTEKSDQVLFVIPKGGLKVTPGQTYIRKLSGGPTFGWKYMVGGYPKGAATFNGRPLLPGAWSTFLFQTFGAN
jgi:hypothetical protein